MKKLIAINDKNIEVEIGDTFFKRFLGLMMKNKIPSNYAILLIPCSRVHTFFMKFPIDIVYLDDKNRVLYKETLYPRKLGKKIKGAKKVLEGSMGFADGLKCNEILVFNNF